MFTIDGSALPRTDRVPVIGPPDPNDSPIERARKSVGRHASDAFIEVTLGASGRYAAHFITRSCAVHVHGSGDTPEAAVAAVRGHLRTLARWVLS